MPGGRGEGHEGPAPAGPSQADLAREAPLPFPRDQVSPKPRGDRVSEPRFGAPGNDSLTELAHREGAGGSAQDFQEDLTEALRVCPVAGETCREDHILEFNPVCPSRLGPGSGLGQKVAHERKAATVRHRQVGDRSENRLRRGPVKGESRSGTDRFHEGGTEKGRDLLPARFDILGNDLPVTGGHHQRGGRPSVPSGIDRSGRARVETTRWNSAEEWI